MVNDVAATNAAHIVVVAILMIFWEWGDIESTNPIVFEYFKGPLPELWRVVNNEFFR